jgi:hypothetical protein
MLEQEKGSDSGGVKVEWSLSVFWKVNERSTGIEADFIAEGADSGFVAADGLAELVIGFVGIVWRRPSKVVSIEELVLVDVFNTTCQKSKSTSVSITPSKSFKLNVSVIFLAFDWSSFY